MSFFDKWKDSAKDFVAKSIYSGYTRNYNSSSAGVNSLLPTQSKTKIEIDPIRLSDSWKKWVYKCTQINSFAMASTNWKLLEMSGGRGNKIFQPIKSKKKLFKHDKSLNTNLRYKYANDDIDELQTHPILTLLETPNPTDTCYDFFFKISINLEMFGTSYVLLTRNGDSDTGQIIQMDVLHSQYITPKVSLPGYVVEGYWYNYNAASTYYKSSQILCIKYYNIYNDIVGFAPLQSIFTQEVLDNLFDEFSIALLQNGGIPGSVIKYTGKSLKEDERNQLESSWNKYLKGGQNNGKVKVIGNDFEVIKLGTDPKDMDFIDGRRVTKESILNAFGVPMSFIDPKDSNRSNLEEATYIYQKYSILPKLQQICDILNKKLVSEFNEQNIYLTFSNPVEQDIKDETDRIYLMLEKGVISIEEARVKLELD